MPTSPNSRADWDMHPLLNDVYYFNKDTLNKQTFPFYDNWLDGAQNSHRYGSVNLIDKDTLNGWASTSQDRGDALLRFKTELPPIPPCDPTVLIIDYESLSGFSGLEDLLISDGIRADTVKLLNPPESISGKLETYAGGENGVRNWSFWGANWPVHNSVLPLGGNYDFNHCPGVNSITDETVALFKEASERSSFHRVHFSFSNCDIASLAIDPRLMLGTGKLISLCIEQLKDGGHFSRRHIDELVFEVSGNEALTGSEPRETAFVFGADNFHKSWRAINSERDITIAVYLKEIVWNEHLARAAKILGWYGIHSLMPRTGHGMWAKIEADALGW